MVSGLSAFDPGIDDAIRIHRIRSSGTRRKLWRITGGRGLSTAARSTCHPITIRPKCTRALEMKSAAAVILTDIYQGLLRGRTSPQACISVQSGLTAARLKTRIGPTKLMDDWACNFASMIISTSLFRPVTTLIAAYIC